MSRIVWALVSGPHPGEVWRVEHAGTRGACLARREWAATREGQKMYEGTRCEPVTVPAELVQIAGEVEAGDVIRVGSRVEVAGAVEWRDVSKVARVVHRNGSRLPNAVGVSK